MMLTKTNFHCPFCAQRAGVVLAFRAFLVESTAEIKALAAFCQHPHPGGESSEFRWDL